MTPARRCFFSSFDSTTTILANTLIPVVNFLFGGLIVECSSSWFAVVVVGVVFVVQTRSMLFSVYRPGWFVSQKQSMIPKVNWIDDILLCLALFPSLDS